MIRTKGEPGTGNVIEAVKHMRLMNEQIRTVIAAPEEEVMSLAKEMGAPYQILRMIRELKRLPVVNFAAGGIATPADAAMSGRGDGGNIDRRDPTARDDAGPLDENRSTRTAGRGARAPQ